MKNELTAAIEQARKEGVPVILYSSKSKLRYIVQPSGDITLDTKTIAAALHEAFISQGSLNLC